MLRHLRGEAVEATQIVTEQVEDLAAALAPEDELGYGYDVQFILQGDSLDVNAVRAAIDRMGWSTVVVGNERAIKVHVHVHDPGIPLSYGVSLGAISDVVVENMQAQFHEYVRERTEQPAQVPAAPEFVRPELEEEDIGVVAVVSGEGLAQVFRQLGAAELVSGGQTNNPSTQEILDAVQRVPTRNVILLPNNKNIILAAVQAARLATNQQVVVIPTRSMPQGISALLPYDPKGDLQAISEDMRQAKDDVITGEVTTATRNVEINGVICAEGQIIGLVDGALSVSGDNIGDVVKAILDQMCSEACELITLYYGNHILEEDARALVGELTELYPDLEFELVFGGQPHYHYILSAE
jgi:DAK2 domain fusion protein YloV